MISTNNADGNHWLKNAGCFPSCCSYVDGVKCVEIVPTGGGYRGGVGRVPRQLDARAAQRSYAVCPGHQPGDATVVLIVVFDELADVEKTNRMLAVRSRSADAAYI